MVTFTNLATLYVFPFDFTGSGPSLETLQVGNKQYILVPGSHQQPWQYCAGSYGAGAAIVYSSDVTSHMKPWLLKLYAADKLKGDSVLVGGRVHALRKGPLANDDAINIEGKKVTS